MEKRIYVGTATWKQRAAGPGDGVAPQTFITGYAARFNSLSEDLGGFKEIIMPGAFAGCLNDDVRALINHDSNLVLARTTAKTLTISEDENGLYFEAIPPDTSYARDLLVSMERGDVTQCSFMFDLSRDGVTFDESGQLATISKVSRLYDVSVVTFPAYPSSNAELVTRAKNIFPHAHLSGAGNVIRVVPTTEAAGQEPESDGGVNPADSKPALALRRRKLELLQLL